MAKVNGLFQDKIDAMSEEEYEQFEKEEDAQHCQSSKMELELEQHRGIK